MAINKGDIGRAPNGISTNDITQNLGFYGLPDPTKYHTFFDDFDAFVAGDYAITSVGASTAATVSGDGGILRLLTDVNVGDSIHLERNEQSFLIESGKPCFYKARMTIDSILQARFTIGLFNGVNPANPLNGVHFLKIPGQTNIRAATSSGGTSSQLNMLDISDGVPFEIGFYFDGDQRFLYFQDGQVVQSVSTFNAPVGSPTLRVAMYLENNEVAVAKTMDLDYVFAAKLR